MSNTYLRAEQILPTEQLAKLGPLGRNLFAAAWNRMRDRGLESIWISDVEMMNRSRIPPDKLATIQNELDFSGLMVVTPGQTQSQYAYVDTEAEATQ
jgi:hypothetical protein